MSQNGTATTEALPEFKDQCRPVEIVKAQMIAVDEVETANVPVSSPPIPIYSLRRPCEETIPSTSLNSNETKGTTRPRQYLVKLTLAAMVLLVVVLAITLGVTLSRNNKTTDSPDNTTEPLPTVPPSSQQLTVAPSLAATTNLKDWAGSYTGQALFGGIGGTWGNGGIFPMVIDRNGQVTIRGQLILGTIEYDPTRNRLEWNATAENGNDTEGQIVFRTRHTSEYFFPDKNSFRVGQSFTGTIRPSPGPSGFLDYRGILE